MMTATVKGMMSDPDHFSENFFPVMLAFLIAGFLVPLRWLERITRKLLFFGQGASVIWGATESRVTASAGWVVVVTLSGDLAAPEASCPPESLAEKYGMNLWSKYSLRNEPESSLDNGYTSLINQPTSQSIYQAINQTKNTGYFPFTSFSFTFFKLLINLNFANFSR